MAYQKCI